jgi:hypothetical protein
MTTKAYLQRDFLVRPVRATTPGASGTAGLSEVSAFVTLRAAPGTEHKLIGVVISELNPAAINRNRDKQYA